MCYILQGAINEANNLNRIPPNLAKEKEEYVYRAYIALGQYNIPLMEIKDTPNTSVGNNCCTSKRCFLFSLVIRSQLAFVINNLYLLMFR